MSCCPESFYGFGLQFLEARSKRDGRKSPRSILNLLFSLGLASPFDLVGRGRPPVSKWEQDPRRAAIRKQSPGQWPNPIRAAAKRGGMQRSPEGRPQLKASLGQTAEI